MSEDQARKAFTRTDELIFQGGKAWVPIEVTEREGTFITAWQEGAKEWRENLAKNQADFYPVRIAWKSYPAVFFPGTSTQPALPDASKVVIDFQADLIALISREIGSKETELKATIKKNPDNIKAINSLGLLYARYDLADKAEAQFLSLLTKGENVPALLNLGNLAFLKADYKKAQGFYQRAYKQSPHSANVLLSMARVNHAQQNYGSVKEYFQELQTVDPDMASEFAYLDLQGTEATRASEANNVLNTVVWEEAK
jgi:tetratricopeptide (TPR) repeat protein